MTFETVDERQFGDFECPNPARQFKIVTSPIRQGRYAARFEVAPGDTWTNGSIRCLVANYNTNEREGDDYYFAFSMFFAKKPSDATIWELHNRKEIYEIDPNTSVSPHAITINGDALEYRLLTGPAIWKGTTWTGFSQYEPNLKLIDDVPIETWIDIVVHVKFTHTSQGVLEVWCRPGDEAWSPEPEIARRGIPTLQWVPGYENKVSGRRNDPAVPSDVYTSSLYTELGLYPGTNSIETTDVVFLDGYRRGSTFASVTAEFP